jgi:hypothetical protein
MKTTTSSTLHDEIFRRNKEVLDKAHQKYGGPAEPLSEEAMDRSETELRNHHRMRASHKSKR